MDAWALRLCLFLALCLQVYSNILPPISLRSPECVRLPSILLSLFHTVKERAATRPANNQQQAERGILDRLVRKMLTTRPVARTSLKKYMIKLSKNCSF